MDDLSEYRALVDKCARQRLDYPIANGDPRHARILIEKLFETARQDVVILSGKLTDATMNGEDIYGAPEIVEHAKRFLRRNDSKLCVMLEYPLHKNGENRLTSALLDDNERKGEIIIYPNNESIREANVAHFMVTDALAYRYETDALNVKAVANFGDTDTANMIRKLFNKLSDFARQEGAERVSHAAPQTQS